MNQIKPKSAGKIAISAYDAQRLEEYQMKGTPSKVIVTIPGSDNKKEL